MATVGARELIRRFKKCWLKICSISFFFLVIELGWFVLLAVVTLDAQKIKSTESLLSKVYPAEYFMNIAKIFKILGIILVRFYLSGIFSNTEKIWLRVKISSSKILEWLTFRI